MHSPRRKFIKTAIVGSTVALGSGTALSQLAFAEEEKKAEEAKAAAAEETQEESPFNQETFDAAVKEHYGTTEVTESDKITVKAPDIAENGKVVPVKVTVAEELGAVSSIALIASKNPAPFIAKFDLDGLEGYVETRIKMGATGNVSAVVKVGDKLYVAHKEVKVTIGGCGG